MSSRVLKVSLIDLDQILESAAVLSWDDLMPEGPDSLIHVEYRGDQNALAYLKVWASAKRGYWSLVCEYFASSEEAPGEGLTFSEGYSSETLADMLNFIIKGRASFASDRQRPNRLVQVHAPSRKDRKNAEQVLRQALDESEFAAMRRWSANSLKLTA